MAIPYHRSGELPSYQNGKLYMLIMCHLGVLVMAHSIYL